MQNSRFANPSALFHATVDSLLAESDSLRLFLQEAVENADRMDVSVNEIAEAYATFLPKKGVESAGDDRNLRFPRKANAGAFPSDEIALSRQGAQQAHLRVVRQPRVQTPRCARRTVLGRSGREGKGCLAGAPLRTRLLGCLGRVFETH